MFKDNYLVIMSVNDTVTWTEVRLVDVKSKIPLIVVSQT